MPITKLAIDPNFHEWALHYLANLSPEDKNMLNNRERAKVATVSEIKRFLSKASNEEIEILLTKTGIQCSRIFFNPGKLDASIIKETYRQYTIKGKALENIDEMLRQNMFVTHSKDIAAALAMCSINCHSDAYRMNTEFIRTDVVVNELMEKISSGSLAKQFAASMNGYKQVIKIMHFAMGLEAYVTGKEDLMPCDLMILTLMALYPTQYVSTSYLMRMLNYKYANAVVQKRTGYLFRKKQYIDMMPASTKKPSYIITQTGMLKVGEFANYILNQSLQ